MKKIICLLFNEVPEGTHYMAGCYSWVENSTAQEYIDEGFAKEYDPQNSEKPTMDNTKAEIQDYLDKKGIQYSDETKQELLDKI